MSEYRTNSFMQDLDLWIEANVVGPLLEAAPDSKYGDAAEFSTTVIAVKNGIRRKVRESFINGRQSVKDLHRALPLVEEARIDGQWVKGGRYHEGQ